MPALQASDPDSSDGDLSGTGYKSLGVAASEFQDM